MHELMEAIETTGQLRGSINNIVGCMFVKRVLILYIKINLYMIHGIIKNEPNNDE